MRRTTCVAGVTMLLLAIGPHAYANTAPTAVDDSVDMYTPDGHSITIYPLANDTDPDGDTLSIRKVFHALIGTVSITEDRQGIVYTVGPGICGQIRDYFTYAAIDPQGARSAQATVTVHIDQGLTCVTVPSYDVSFREGQFIPKHRGGIEVDWFGACPIVDKCTGIHLVPFTIEDVTTSPNDYYVRRYALRCSARQPVGYARIVPLEDRRTEDTETLHVVLQNVIIADGGSNVITMHIRDND